MLNSDIVVASKYSYSNRGTTLACLLVWCNGSFVQATGWAKAMKYVLTGDLFYAQTAYEMNLVTEVVEGNNQLIRALELAERIAQATPLAVQAH